MIGIWTKLRLKVLFWMIRTECNEHRQESLLRLSATLKLDRNGESYTDLEDYIIGTFDQDATDQELGLLIGRSAGSIRQRRYLLWRQTLCAFCEKPVLKIDNDTPARMTDRNLLQVAHKECYAEAE